MHEKDGRDYLIEELREQVNRKTVECERLTRERDEYLYHLEETRKSFSYKLGMALTALPRKTRKSEHVSR